VLCSSCVPCRQLRKKKEDGIRAKLEVRQLLLLGRCGCGLCWHGAMRQMGRSAGLGSWHTELRAGQPSVTAQQQARVRAAASAFAARPAFGMGKVVAARAQEAFLPACR
jgi:hypothetical protein